MKRVKGKKAELEGNQQVSHPVSPRVGRTLAEVTETVERWDVFRGGQG